MRNTHKFFIFTISALLCACQANKDKPVDANTNYELLKKSTIFIPIDSATGSVQKNIQYLEANNELVILNTAINTLQFYDFQNKGKELKRVVLEQEGDNGVGNISDFLVHTEDSIFVLDAPMYKLSLVNGKGKPLNTYSLYNKIGQNAMPDPFPFTPIVFLNNKVYISSAPVASSNEGYYNLEACVIIVDLKTKNITHKYGFPEVYKKNTYAGIAMFSRIYSPKHKKFIHSFWADHHLQVTDYETNTAYLAQSKRLMTVATLDKEITNGKEINRVANETSSFFTIEYDKFRDIFYRSFEIREPNMPSKNGFIILNTNFEKIGEVEKGSIVNIPLHPVFTKEGVWMLNTKGKEGVITYDLFELIKK